MRYLSIAILAMLLFVSVVAAEATTGYELRLGINTRKGRGCQPEKSIALTTPFGLEIWDTNVSEVNFQPQELKIGLIRPICASPEATVSLGVYWSEIHQQTVPDSDFLVIAGKINGKIAGNSYNVRMEYYMAVHGTFYPSHHLFRLTDMFVERPVSKNIRLGLTGDYHYNFETRGGSVLFGPRISIDAGKSATLNVSYLNWGTYQPQQQLHAELVCRF